MSNTSNQSRKGLSRRGFLATGAAAISLRAAPSLVRHIASKRVTHLYIDKATGMMRLVDKLAP